MLAVEQVQQFFLYKKRTDSRFSVPTVVDLFIDNDDDGDEDLRRSHNGGAELLHCHGGRYDWIRIMDQRREKIKRAQRKNRFLVEELNIAVEQLATDRANLMLERHLLAVTKERMRMQKEKWSSSNSLRGLIRSKFKGIPPESLSVESLLDVDKNNNTKSSSASTSDVDPGRDFQTSIMLEDRLRKYFPKLRERCRNLADVDEATKLQEDIKLQEEILNYLYLKVEAIVFKKEFKKPSKTKAVPSTRALVPLSSTSTFSTPKLDDRRRKRKQLVPSTASSRLQAQSSEDARSSGLGSMENLFRDVIGHRGTDSQSTSRSTSSIARGGGGGGGGGGRTFQQVTIQIVDS